MPISIDQFDEYESPEHHKTNAERVIHFLVENRDKAFKAAEIANATGINQNSIQPVLNRLRKRDLVRHKEPYWAIGDLESIREAYLLHSTSTFLADALGEEDRNEWLAAAEAASEE